MYINNLRDRLSHMITDQNRQNILQRDSVFIGILSSFLIWLLAGPALGLIIASSIPGLHPNTKGTTIETIISIIFSALFSFLAVKHFRKKGKISAAKSASWTSWIVAVLYLLLAGPYLVAFIADWNSL